LEHWQKVSSCLLDLFASGRRTLHTTLPIYIYFFYKYFLECFSLLL